MWEEENLSILWRNMVKTVKNEYFKSAMKENGILFILNAVGKSEKSFPNEKEK